VASRSDIERVAADYRARLAQIEAEYVRAVGPARRAALRRIRDELGRFMSAIAVEGVPAAVTRRWVTNLDAYRRLVAVAEQELDAVSREAVQAIRWRIAEAATLAPEGADALVAASLGQPGASTAALFGQVNVGAITQLVGALQASSPLVALPGLTEKVVQQMMSELVRGLVNGTHSRVIGRRIMQATGMPATRAQVIARTEIHRAYRESSRMAFQANRAVNAWRWHASLGPRTCASCWAMHGTVHDLDEPMGSHPQCRCTMLPVIDAARALGFDAPTIHWPTGDEVFAAQPVDVQRAVLGSKSDAYAEGRITLADTVHVRESVEFGTTRTVASLDQALRAAG
jgi:SPP1 gp7 family putative phage head morphogenesis protein